MPQPRPYASRGVPRRATTGWSANRARSWPRVGAALSGLVLVVAAVACVVVSPFASPSVGRAPASLAPSEDATAVADGEPFGGPAQAVAPTSTDQLAATTRAWDSAVPGITNDPMLASRLDQALVGVDGHVGVAVKDLGSGRGAVLGGNLELQSASLYKLPVMYTVFDLGLSMSEELTITGEALAYDSGTMELGPGETLSVAEALERMVTLSDNTSAVLLGSRVGAGNITANLATLDMDTTHYSLERMTTSALDMLHFLDLVASGQTVSRSASADMLHLMLRQRVNDRLPRLLPDDVQVAHKTGNLPGVVNDVGVLYGPKSTVAVAALVSDTTDETAAATAIAQIGLAASTYFEEQPAVAERPLIPPAPSRAIPPVWREPHPPTPTPVPAVVRAPTAVLAVVARPTSQPTVVATAPATAAATTAPTIATSAPTSAPATPAPTTRPTSPPAGATPTRVAPVATPTPVPAKPTQPPARATGAPTPTLPPNRR